jgi:asparagine synthase (glutamine-hydrolysing)
MCGIAGFAHWDGRPVERDILKRMADSLVHRGPDEQGLYVSPHSPGCNVGLGHRRLAIIDLASGQQPLSNEDGTVWIVFNGEIYNFTPLQRELAARGHRFNTHSDTEVIVHAYEEWGEECLSRLNGMFAFCIWDERRQRLFIARDRIGKKPLYYHATPQRFVFGSELKAVLAYPGIDTRPDATAIADYFKFLYVPDPKSIYRAIRKLPPAHYLIADRSGVQVREYWDVPIRETPLRSESDLEEELFDLLQRAVSERLMSEVPLGAFLSGGVDSSGVVALMAKGSPRPVITCSIGFDDPDHDESHYAAEVARILHTDHSEYFVNGSFIETVRRIPAMFDEPFADGSAVPTFYVCQMARQRVTVALSGDGGDEAFAGYDKYVKDGIERQVACLVPDFLLQAVRAASGGGGTLRRKAYTLADQALRSPEQAFYRSNSFIRDADLQRLLAPSVAAELSAYDPSPHITRYFKNPAADDHLTRMDMKTYLPGDVLVKVDRTSMANSLEVRAPLLDYRIMEFAMNLPRQMKIRRGSKKYLLKKAFSRVLPKSIFERPKHGFTVPLGSWFRGELAPMAEEVLFSGPQTSELLDVGFIRQLYDDHRAGRAEHGTLLWSTLNFALWQRESEAHSLVSATPNSDRERPP